MSISDDLKALVAEAKALLERVLAAAGLETTEDATVEAGASTDDVTSSEGAEADQTPAVDTPAPPHDQSSVASADEDVPGSP
jgi:hypothetical protein